MRKVTAKHQTLCFTDAAPQFLQKLALLNKIYGVPVPFIGDSKEAVIAVFIFIVSFVDMFCFHTTNRFMTSINLQVF